MCFFSVEENIEKRTKIWGLFSAWKKRTSAYRTSLCVPLSTWGPTLLRFPATQHMTAWLLKEKDGREMCTTLITVWHHYTWHFQYFPRTGFHAFYLILIKTSFRASFSSILRKRGAAPESDGHGNRVSDVKVTRDSSWQEQTDVARQAGCNMNQQVDCF